MRRFAETADYGASPERNHRIMVYPDALPELDHGTTLWQPAVLHRRVRIGMRDLLGRQGPPR
jgi:hypothetical protein